MWPKPIKKHSFLRSDFDCQEACFLFGIEGDILVDPSACDQHIGLVLISRIEVNIQSWMVEAVDWLAA